MGFGAGHFQGVSELKRDRARRAGVRCDARKRSVRISYCVNLSRLGATGFLENGRRFRDRANVKQIFGTESLANHMPVTNAVRVYVKRCRKDGTYPQFLSPVSLPSRLFTASRLFAAHGRELRIVDVNSLEQNDAKP